MIEISGIGVFTVFAAGLISFLSPCVLPLVPGYLSFIAGKSLTEISGDRDWATTAKTFYLSLFFVSGFSIVFILLGAGASMLGRLLLLYRYEASIGGGLIIIVFGIFMTGLVKIPWLHRYVRYHGEIRGGRAVSAFGLGLAFAFGWTPCIGPILGAILTVSAVSTNNFNGVALLGIYSLGLAVPFMLIAVFTGTYLANSKALNRIGRPLQIAAGIIMIVMGVAMMTGYLTTFSYWLLKTFPGLGAIG
jgi:cytochrome c-type biogenesis protein